MDTEKVNSSNFTNQISLDVIFDFQVYLLQKKAFKFTLENTCPEREKSN